jgi:ABC-type multidrug transport system fused ATPase/permease subunit
MIPLWKGKNPIYFGVITIIPFDNLYRRAYFVMHTFLVYHCFSGGLTPSSVTGNINFKGVSFAYPSRQDANIFQNLSLSVPSGSITAVVGPSGSGKSTIGSLLLRFYDPLEGKLP